MKIKEDLMLREICGEWIIIPMGERLLEFNGMLKLNETGAFLWEKLQQDTTIEDLTEATIAEYNVSVEDALKAISAFLDDLRSVEVLDE